MENLLKEHGIRSTRARLEILELLKNNDPMTAEEVYEKLQANGAKLSSVYRNLALFVDNHIVTKFQGIDNFAYYQINDHSHKHHLTCAICKKTMAIENCPIHELQHEIEKQTNYKITNHIFEFIGICPECQKKEKVSDK